MDKIVREVFDWVKSFFIAFLAIFLISTFITQHYTVKGDSMEPTFDGTEPTQDRVLINKLAKPHYGDIVIVDSRVERERSLKDGIIGHPLVQLFNNNSTENKFWIKRVIGLPGDLIEVRDGEFYRNGEKLEESFILEKMTISFEPFFVPEESVFLMGDNRNYSLDSTEVGPFPISNIVGEVYIRFYPFSRFGLF
jgi:signal peptidase I